MGVRYSESGKVRGEVLRTERIGGGRETMILIVGPMLRLTYRVGVATPS